MTDTRTRIVTYVGEHPGIHFNELVRRLGLASGQVQHHVRQSLANGTLEAKSLYGRTHYYPPEYDEWERRALALLCRETAGDVVAVILERGEVRPATVAEVLDIARSTLEWHLDRLVEQDIVDKQYNANKHVRLTLSRPAETAYLLREAYPSMPDRMVDRFTRLVDRLLGE